MLRMNYFHYPKSIFIIVNKELFGQTYGWKKISSGVPQGLVLGTLLFMIFINNLPDGITSMCKVFVDDTSLFSKVLDLDKSVAEINTVWQDKSMG